MIIMAGLIATEGADMKQPIMPYKQDQMVTALLEANSNNVVVLKNSAPMVLPWIDQAPAVLEAWNQGTEDGHVVPELLWGVVNPSGKVPTTYAAKLEDLMEYGDEVRYPGTDEGAGYPVMRYTEGLEMGYRWYQGQNIKPLFPFGYGLSYTTFEVSDVALSTTSTNGSSPVTVTAKVTNTGGVEGAEVVQVYLGIPVDGQPPKRLVGFQKVTVAPGASAQVSIELDPNATNHPFSVWDYATGAFQVKPGEYTVYVGTSSEDTPNELKLQIS